MNAAACDDRGADLFLVARGAPPEGDLAAHLAACAGCRADLERLRLLARDLPAASEGLAPLPATRAAVLADAGLPPRAESPPAPRRRTGGALRLLVPAAALAASAGIVAFVLARGPRGPDVDASLGAIEVAADGGGAALEGLAAGGLRAGAILTARRVAAVRIGPPVAAAAVLGEGTRLRLSGPDGGRTAEILEGIAWFAPEADGPAPLRVRAGGLEVEGRGARFTVELRAGGASAVCLESGSAVLRSGGGETTVTGPARVDVPGGGRPGPPQSADPADAAAWFARPEVELEAAPGVLVVNVRPGGPVPLRIAPFDSLAAPFSIRAERPGRPPVTVPVAKGMLRGPAPPADGDGAFLLSAARSYRISLDAGSLGLEPGTWTLSAVYSARGGAGSWQGTRSSKPVEFVVE